MVMQISNIVSNAASLPSIVSKALPWAASQCMQLVRAQLYDASNTSTSVPAVGPVKEEQKQSKKLLLSARGAAAGAVLVALLSKVRQMYHWTNCQCALFIH